MSKTCRVVRSGSFYDNRKYVRCASRNSTDPDYRDYFSFRVVVVVGRTRGKK